MGPKALYLGLTNRCNSRCVTCWHGYSKQESLTDLPKNILDDVVNNVLPNVPFLFLGGGGEPLLYPYISELLNKILDLPVQLSIVTSGIGLSNIVAELLVRNNAEIIISIDAHDKDLYHEIRPGLNYEVLIRNLKNMRQKIHNINSKATIVFQMTLSSLNINFINEVLYLARRFEAKILRLQYGISSFAGKYANKTQIDSIFMSVNEMESYLRINKHKLDLRANSFGIAIDYPFQKETSQMLEFRVLSKIIEEDHNELGFKIKIREDGVVLSNCDENSKVLGNLLTKPWYLLQNDIYHQ